MIKLGVMDWFLIILNVALVIGWIWSIRFARKIGYPSIRRDAAFPIALTIIYTIVLWLYLFGVIND